MADDQALDRLVLGGDPVHTARGLCDDLGLGLDDLRRIWRTLGFPEVDADVVAFTEADAEAIGLIKLVLDSGLLERDAVVGVVRSLGQTMARLADWDVTTLVPRAQPGEGMESLAGRRRQGVEQLFSEFGEIRDRLLVYAYRRHLSAALTRVLAVDEPASSDDSLIDVLGAEAVHAAEVTVGFADLVGFTALSNELGEDRIGDLVEIFESRCHDVVNAAGGRIIKSLGDSVLFVADTAEDAMDIADGIVAMIGRDDRLPDVRIGMATGPVSTRLGDVFGPAVNLAARLTGVARRNRVIIDQVTSDRLPADRFDVRRIPARPLRGFGDVEPVTVRRI